MMIARSRLTAVVPALLASCLLAVPAMAGTTRPVAGQVPTAAAAAPAAPAAPARAPFGVTPTEVVAWLKAQGLTAGAPETDGTRRFTQVQADGLSWLLFFQSCEADLCSDLQFTTAVASATITPDLINGWNRDRRFMKAIYEAPAGTSPATGVVQYDVLLDMSGPDQLADHLAIWRGLLPEFARLTTGAQAAK